MTAHVLSHGLAAADASCHRTERRTGDPVQGLGSTGLGGNTLARMVEEHCPCLSPSAGVVIEYLDAQAGTWQFSIDAGLTWRSIRTDLINRRSSHQGLALDSDARLRVLPFGGQRVSGARMAFHTVPHSHGPGNGSYRAYASDEREEGSSTVTLVLSLAAINGAPPAAQVQRLRNKRALAQRAAAASGGIALAG